MNSSLLREFGDCIFQLQQRQTDEDSTINFIVKKVNDLESQHQGKVPRELIKLKKDLVSFQNSETRDSLSKESCSTELFRNTNSTLVKQLREISGNFENKRSEISMAKIEGEESIFQPKMQGRAKLRKRFGRGIYNIANEKAREHAILLVCVFYKFFFKAFM